LIYLLFLVSGLSGLIYEVVWARQLTLVLGSTTYAHTAIVVAYMLGLAAGGVYFGRVADRREDWLRIYAALEIGIAVYAAATLVVFGAPMQAAYTLAAEAFGTSGAVSHLLRFTLALGAVVIATFMMGGTLPVLVRAMTRDLSRLPTETARLYGINTMGAMLGAFAAGFMLLPGVGVRGAILVGVAINVLVAVIAIVLYRRGAAQRDVTPITTPASFTASVAPLERALPLFAGRMLLIGFAVSGFSALVYQLAWIRALTLVFGSSVYAFSATLTTFLIGIGAGSLLYAHYAARLANRGPAAMSTRRRLGEAAIMQLCVGLSAVAADLLLSGIAQGFAERFEILHLYIFALSVAVMIVPTLLLGALFPLITGLWTHDVREVGQGVGTAYAANTAGTILGALAGGLLLTPRIGVQNTIIVAAPCTSRWRWFSGYCVPDKWAVPGVCSCRWRWCSRSRRLRGRSLPGIGP